MAKPLFSPLWYRVASVQPRLRSHVQIHRHHYRGQVWYVLQDDVGGRYHRFTPSAHYIISLMDGKATLQQIWEKAVTSLGEEAPSQDDTIQLLGQLHGANVLNTNVVPDTDEIFQRHRKQKHRQLKQKLMSPLSMRFSLWDPEKFLSRYEKRLRPLFGWCGGLIWLVVVVTGIVQASVHWPELSENVSDTVLTPSNLLMIWLLFPVVKAIHELGHGFATKIWGGEVHEMGIMLLVFMPVPYVDASAASAFRERYKRIIVGAAGMVAELFLAALAVLLWLQVEPGLIRSMAYNVMLIAGVSTLFFNANPLLRFDGYYVLADVLEIPNLAGRSNQYIGYLIQRYLFGVRQARSPVTARGEKFWFAFYSITSFFYRMLVMVAIALFVAGKFFFIGVLLAGLAAFNMFLLPLVKNIKFLLTSPVLERKRSRSVLTTVGVCAVVALFIGLYPAPHWSNAEGVVWLPDDASVRVGESCFVERLLAEEGETVSAGQPLVACRNNDLQTELEQARLAFTEVRQRYISELRQDRVKAEITREQMNSVRASLLRVQEKVDALTIKSPSAGLLSIPYAQDLAEKFVHKGETIAYVLPESRVSVRAVVTQQTIELVHQRSEGVELMLADAPGQSIEGMIKRQIPGASHQLPSAALGSMGGGSIPADPRQPDGLTTFSRIFQFDIEMPEGFERSVYGGRAYIRFNHGTEPLAIQWYRSIRQLFLGAFGV